MSRRIAIVWPGVLLVAIVGCSLDSFTVPFGGNVGHKQVVTGSVDQVATKLQEGLSEAGIVVIVKHHDEELRLFCQTKTGTRFCLMLNTQKTNGTDKTAVVMWDKAVDELSWQLVVKLLAAPAATSDDSLRLRDTSERNDSNRE